MAGPAVMYLHLSFEDYKAVEAQCKAWNETTHKSGGDLFYHKACRIKVNDGLIIEVHGPLVGGGAHRESER
jgi:hypothetical protein